MKLNIPTKIGGICGPTTNILWGCKFQILYGCIYKYDIVTFGGVVFQQIVVIKMTILGVYTSVLSVILSFEPLVPQASHPQV